MVDFMDELVAQAKSRVWRDAVATVTKQGIPNTTDKESIMEFIGTCTPDEYVVSYYLRKTPREALPPHKFPFRGEDKFKWERCRIQSQEELANLCIHQDGDWLEKRGLRQNSGLYGMTLLGKRLELAKLGSLAKTAMDIGFFSNAKNADTAQYNNYHRWKGQHLYEKLAGHNKPMLVQRFAYIDILDGFGRLLPYLVLVLEGARFFPFEAYFATPAE